MSEPGMRMGSDAIAEVMPATGTPGGSMKLFVASGPTESEIAAAAYQLWLDNGCPVGSEKADWFRAEEALKKAHRDTRTEGDEVVEFQCWGHWEVWEMEWGAPRWVWDRAAGSLRIRLPHQG